MAGTRTGKNHYNPTGYLRRFAGSDGKISRYDRRYKNASRKNPAAFGYKLNFYDQFVENSLAKIDGRYCNAIDKLDMLIQSPTTGKPLGFKYVQDIALFLTFQFGRTPKFKNDTQKLIQKANSQNPFFRIPEMKPVIKAYFSEQRYFQKYMFDFSKGLYEELMSHVWLLLRSEDDTYFITSDTVFSAATLDLEGNASGLGLSSLKTLKLFPLSKRICLALTDRRGSPIEAKGTQAGIRCTDPVTKDKVLYYNAIIHLDAYLYSYFPEQSMIEPILEESTKIQGNTQKELRRISKGIPPTTQ